MYMPSTKREIRHFNVVVVKQRQRNVQKSVMHVQSCCFANLILLLLCRSRCRRLRRRRRLCLSSLKLYTGRLRPKVQLLTLLYTIFDRKGDPFI